MQSITKTLPKRYINHISELDLAFICKPPRANYGMYFSTPFGQILVHTIETVDPIPWLRVVFLTPQQFSHTYIIGPAGVTTALDKKLANSYDIWPDFYKEPKVRKPKPKKAPLSGATCPGLDLRPLQRAYAGDLRTIAAIFSLIGRLNNNNSCGAPWTLDSKEECRAKRKFQYETDKARLIRFHKLGKEVDKYAQDNYGGKANPSD